MAIFTYRLKKKKIKKSGLRWKGRLCAPGDFTTHGAGVGHRHPLVTVACDTRSCYQLTDFTLDFFFPFFFFFEVGEREKIQRLGRNRARVTSSPR